MGLGAPKRRNKLSHDPNNTTWSRSTSNFGHRILSQQGWQPGQYLGAENANHSDHYTAANASHIRILLREDNLGLGAKIGGNKAETFGLSLFSGVLGRLNGKSDDQLQKQQDALRDAELRQYQVGKYGLMNFVSGGLLVGDKIEQKPQQGSDEEAALEVGAVGKGGKKRKLNEGESGGPQRSRDEKQKIRKVKQYDGANDAAPPSSADREGNESPRRSKKKPKRAAAESDIEELSETATAKKPSKKRQKTSSNDAASQPKVSADEKVRLKQEKRVRKEDRRRRKAAKRLRKAEESTTKQRAEQESRPITQPAPTVNGGRHAVRQRYIQQKRMAGLDAQAMKEIFMIKATA